MTTDAKRVESIIGNEGGQSVLEFLFMLPVMVSLLVLMTRVNSAIQVSIVDQQYARAQAHFLTFSSPVYPEVRLRYAQLVGKNYNQMLMGVGDNIVPGDGSAYTPIATTQNIARNRKIAALGNNDPQKEPNPDSGEGRALVRVRGTVSLCTQINVINVNGALQSVLDMVPGTLADGGTPQGGVYHLSEDPKQFAWCKAQVIHE
jgi:hypothetical protein